jgi:biotin-(acetyl-CoA carboxylase) ligase
MVGDDKVGGILVEKSGDMAVVGIGINLWWHEAPTGMAALFDEDPGEDRYAELGALWGAELMQLLDADEWPIDEYRNMCMTLGVEIKWEPEGMGRALDVSNDGGLVVDRDGKTEVVYSGEIHHLRHR